MTNAFLLQRSLLCALTVALASAFAGCSTTQPMASTVTQPEPKQAVVPITKNPGYTNTPMVPGTKWHVHDGTRPQPRIVTSGATFSHLAPPPSDAIVLFDGTDLSKWRSGNGEAKWKIENGYMEVAPKTGSIQTKGKFADFQLHLEFATPAKVDGNSQGRGNSGVFLMRAYEVQVLDSFENQTYADGQAGALYGRQKPLVNVCRKPGEWQTYDIIFHRPLFDASGKVTRRATFTVLHNGVLIQDHTVLSGGTGWMGSHAASEYEAHPDKQPFAIQDHGNPVRYRNIWIRELKD